MRFIMPSLGLSAVATLCLALAAPGVASPADLEARWMKPAVEQAALGVWKVRFGTPERFTPGAIREAGPRMDDLRRLPPPGALPFEPGEIRCRLTPSHTAVYIPCDEPEEQIYGFGLDPGAYEQKGLRKYLTVCAAVMGKTGADQASVLQVARSLREMKIPCDMLGLEPGWQSQAHSCSLAWSKERFPQHEAMVRELQRSGFKINLWEHAYIHPTSPLF
jgi:hypothetical protein